VGEGPST
jgi:hypothetical protein